MTAPPPHQHSPSPSPSPVPSSPFSFVSSLRSEENDSDAFSDLELDARSDAGSIDVRLDQLEVRSFSGSEVSWDDFVNSSVSPRPSSPAESESESVPPSPSVEPNVYETPPASLNSSAYESAPLLLRSPSPSPPSTPRPRSPPLLQFPVSHPSAPIFSLLKVSNLPQWYTLDDLVHLLTGSLEDNNLTATYKSRRAVPLWISFRPAFSELGSSTVDADSDSGRKTPTQEEFSSLRASALLRFTTAEDALTLSVLLDHLRSTLQSEELFDFETDRWLWVLDVEAALVGDDEVERGEEEKGLLWVCEWLRAEDGKLLVKKADAPDSRTSVLVSPLPYSVTLKSLIDHFSRYIPTPSSLNAFTHPPPKATGVILLPDLAAHTIYLPCAVLQYATHDAAELAASHLPTTLYYEGEGGAFVQEESAGAGAGKWAVEYKLGDWRACAMGVGGLQLWDAAEEEAEKEREKEFEADREREEKNRLQQDLRAARRGEGARTDPAPTPKRQKHKKPRNTQPAPLPGQNSSRPNTRPLPPLPTEGKKRSWLETGRTATARSVRVKGLPPRTSLDSLVRVYAHPRADPARITLFPTHPLYSPHAPFCILTYADAEAVRRALPTLATSFVVSAGEDGDEETAEIRYAVGVWDETHEMGEVVGEVWVDGRRRERNENEAAGGSPSGGTFDFGAAPLFDDEETPFRWDDGQSPPPPISEDDFPLDVSEFFKIGGGRDSSSRKPRFEPVSDDDFTSPLHWIQNSSELPPDLPETSTSTGRPGAD